MSGGEEGASGRAVGLHSPVGHLGLHPVALCRVWGGGPGGSSRAVLKIVRTCIHFNYRIVVWPSGLLQENHVPLFRPRYRRRLV